MIDLLADAFPTNWRGERSFSTFSYFKSYYSYYPSIVTSSIMYTFFDLCSDGHEMLFSTYFTRNVSYFCYDAPLFVLFCYTSSSLRGDKASTKSPVAWSPPCSRQSQFFEQPGGYRLTTRADCDFAAAVGRWRGTAGFSSSASREMHNRSVFLT